MHKTSRLVRRSTIKLKSLSGGHSDLLMIISQLQEVKDNFKAFIMAQAILMEDLLKWSSKLEVPSIKKTFTHYSELSQLWTDVQKEFSDNIKSLKSEFEMILDGEQHVDVAREALKEKVDAEEKCGKDLSKYKDSSGNAHALRAKLKRCERASQLAREDLAVKVRENETVKLVRLKKGLRKYGRGYVDMAHKCTCIYKAHCMITEELPDAEGRNILDLVNKETSCEGYVREAKNQVCLYNCRIAANAISPPYSPTNNMNNLSVDISNASIRGEEEPDSPVSPSAPPEPPSAGFYLYPSMPDERDFTCQQGRTDVVTNVQSRVFCKRLNTSCEGASPPEEMAFSRMSSKRHLKFTTGQLNQRDENNRNDQNSSSVLSSCVNPTNSNLQVTKQHPYNPYDYRNGC